MDKIELREKIHRTTSLLARRIVAEASKKSISGDMIVRFNNEADNELLVLTDQNEEQHYNPNCPQCYENLLKSGVPEQIRKEERERAEAIVDQYMANGKYKALWDDVLVNCLSGDMEYVWKQIKQALSQEEE